ncbi:hypothetical protein GYMLUDRAFT_72584 [Collybiopsis luxurians FD-317 M1]|uniref:Fruit-body specific protein a n=1 Tax=Collybiopsis luxurians FD-317 M1 TaxID=944289 RepID=A0A0D0D1B6_9AGAR|nr:hypothetical protein GYMLUDRAFT_72584 [Collybiopsis luxurians FD-317 M1]
MFSPSQLLVFAGLAVSLAECALVAPANKGVPATISDPADFNGTTTDTSAIASTAQQVDQKSGAPTDVAPNQPVADTTVTAVDGDLVNATVASTSRRSLTGAASHLSRRNNSNYELVFWGTGTGPNDRDASIEGTAYLTYTVVSNATYDIDDCLAKCDSVDGCVFANLYYEFNNPGLDHQFSEGSNLKCALYADIHNATEKTNFGGQQLYPAPGGLTYIQQSSGWAAKSLVDPATPSGYDLVFGPTNGANNAPGYMGFAFLDKYDVDACATLCNQRGADPVGGACQYFNIWRAVVNGVPTTYTCSMYYIVADESTAVNYGQGSLVVTESRGYKRQNIVVDGGFEGYTCDDEGDDVPFCFTASYANWQGTSPAGGTFDASIFNYQPYAHTGSAVALLGSAFDFDSLPGTLAPTQSLATHSGASYTLQFFHSSFYSGQVDEANATLAVIWNGQTIDTLHPGFAQWTPHQYTVTAKGNDQLQFTGGNAPAYVFVDDVSLYPL